MTLDNPGVLILTTNISFERDIVTVRQRTRRLSQLLGFETQDQVRLSTAVSELARNVFQYAGKGKIEFYFSLGIEQAIFVRVTDSGPGIKNVDEILSGSYISKSGMGVGLLGSKKIMDYFQIKTEIDKGCIVQIGKKLGARAIRLTDADLDKITASLTDQPTSSPFEEMQNQNRDLLKALDELRLRRQELSELNQELSETNTGVVALYAELDERASSLKSANEAKTRFLSNMSHEIRTPLGVIQGFADIALDPDLDATERAIYLITIKRNAASLTHLIGEILDLAKIEAGKIEIEKARFSLTDMINDISDAFSLQIRNKGLTYQYSASDNFPEFVTSDAMRIRQVLINVISNAIKFTERGGIAIKAQLSPEGATDQENQIEFYISDSGIGLTGEQQLRLFEAFMQADSSTTRKYGGTGLGLNLSKHLSHSLGGDLVLHQSVINKGSTFKFTFDAGKLTHRDFPTKVIPCAATRELNQTRKLKKLDGMNLLLVEDSPDLQMLCTRALMNAGASVDIASDGLQGVQKAKSGKYNVILMDIQMPLLDGIEATKSLRSSGELLPIIALTAHAMKEDRENALKIGFTDYLTKPLDLRILVDTIARFRH